MTTEELVPTPRYRRVLESATGIAREMGHSYLGVEHLFLAVIGDRAAVPTQVLARATDLDQLEASLLEVMAAESYRGKPPEDAVWFPVSELRELLKAVRSSVPPGVEYGFNVVGDQAWIHVSAPGDTAEVLAAARALLDSDGS